MSRLPAVGLSLLLTACTLLQRKPAPEPLVSVTGEGERLESYLRSALGEGGSRQSLRLVGKLLLSSTSGSLQVREVVVARRPACLRMESLDWLGRTRTLLVSNGQRYGFFDGRELQQGPVDDRLLLDRLGLDLRVGEAVALLLASPPLRASRPLAVFARGETRIARLEGHEVSFDAGGRLLGVTKLPDRSRGGWRVQYSHWSEVRGGRYPAGLAFSFPATGVRARLEVSEVELNLPLDEALFELPEGLGG